MRAVRTPRSQLPEPAQPPVARVAEALAAIDSPGSFATRLGAPARDLAIEVTGVGRLALPITRRTIRALLGVAQPSPFGLGEETLHDPQVRCSLEIPGRRVKIAPGWRPALAQHLEGIRCALGLPEGQRLEAVLDKLVLYEEGQFFKAHQDSERDDRMVASLVVVLPSEYEGGSLTVEHRGEKKTFHRVQSQSRDLSHETLRRGSPQVLQLRKTDALFAREREHRKEAAALLAGLGSPPKAPRSSRRRLATAGRRPRAPSS